MKKEIKKQLEEEIPMLEKKIKELQEILEEDKRILNQLNN